jgi:MFS family permease
MMLCVFLFALDVLILSTAIPKIVSQFNSLAQVAWVNNGFFLTLAGFSLAWGQFLTIWKVSGAREADASSILSFVQHRWLTDLYI